MRNKNLSVYGICRKHQIENEINRTCRFDELMAKSFVTLIRCA